jgi:hypothetical protein
MKSIALMIALALLVSIFTLPVRAGTAHGAYNTISRLYWCDTRAACFHEIGHKLDQEGGWISHTPEFDTAFQEYKVTEFLKHSKDPDFLLGTHFKITWLITVYPESIQAFPYFIDSQSEVYATFLELSGGRPESVPAVLRDFYDWDTVRVLAGMP